MKIVLQLRVDEHTDGCSRVSCVTSGIPCVQRGCCEFRVLHPGTGSPENRGVYACDPKLDIDQVLSGRHLHRHRACRTNGETGTVRGCGATIACATLPTLSQSALSDEDLRWSSHRRGYETP